MMIEARPQPPLVVGEIETGMGVGPGVVHLPTDPVAGQGRGPGRIPGHVPGHIIAGRVVVAGRQPNVTILLLSSGLC